VTGRFLAALSLGLLAACAVPTDPATRLAADIENGAGRLRAQEGATDSVHHETPSRPGECDGPYKIQLDQVGALIVWCKDAAGKVVSSHSTSAHAPVETTQTFIVEKGAGETLIVDLERRGNRAVITEMR
jgi:hypothetical protein